MSSENREQTKYTNPNKNKRKNKWWYVAGILIAIIIVAVAGVYGYVGSRIHKNPNIHNVKGAQIVNNQQKDPAIENILIIGVDEGDRSDIMMVASINRKENTLKLASILRDIKVYFPDKKSYGNLNASYRYGGPEETVNMINSNFKLDIKKYIVVDFRGFKNIIDTVNGVPVTLTDKEASYIKIGPKGGTYNLDGDHALAYVRTRYIDNDFKRTQRQRNVMLSLYNKFKNVDLSTKISAANQCLAYVQTNMSVYELTGNLLNFESKMKSNIQQLEIPTDGDGMYTIETKPLWYFDLNWDKEVAVLQKFIYGN